MTLDSEWERFRGGPRRPSNERIHITLNRKSELYLNANAYRVMGRPEAVHLYFNRKKESMALSPAASARLSDAFPVKEKVPGSYIVHLSPFCQNFGIRVTKTQKFVGADLDNDGNMLLDLSTMVTVTKPRGPNKR